MLWHIYPENLDQLTLREAYQTLQGDPASQIPFPVWLMENPDSPLSLPGKVSLYHHDCLHLLLKQGFNSVGEAYVVGFSMGNDRRTRWFHLWIFKLVAQFLYPDPYRFYPSDLKHFDAGARQGSNTRVLNLSQTFLSRRERTSLPELRHVFGL